MSNINKTTERQRSERIEVRLTVDEAHELVTRAINSRMSISEFVRKSSLASSGHAQKELPDRLVLIDELEQLNTIGMTLSQLIRGRKFTDSDEQMLLINEALLGIKSLSGELIKKLTS